VNKVLPLVLVVAERQGAFQSRSTLSRASSTLVKRGNDILLRLQELSFETLHFLQVLDAYLKFPVEFIPSLHCLCNLHSYFFSFSWGYSI